jgi:hypothetical protein
VILPDFSGMSDTTFGFLLLFSNLVLWVLNRTTKRLANDQPWSNWLSYCGHWLVIASTGLFLLGMTLDWLAWLPFQVAVNSLKLGLLCLVVATPVVISTFIWNLHTKIGFRQIAGQLYRVIHQRLPDFSTQQTLLNLMQFAGTCCVFIALLGRDVLIIVAELGVLDDEEKEKRFGLHYNYMTCEIDEGFEVNGIYHSDD